MGNLDAGSGRVYLGGNLIEARAAAILTPHLRGTRLCCFWGFPVSTFLTCGMAEAVPFQNSERREFFSEL